MKYNKGTIVRTFIQNPVKGFVPCIGTILEEVDKSKWFSKEVPLYKVMLSNSQVVTYPEGLIRKF